MCFNGFGIHIDWFDWSRITSLAGRAKQPSGRCVAFFVNVAVSFFPTVWEAWSYLMRNCWVKKQVHVPYFLSMIKFLFTYFTHTHTMCLRREAYFTLLLPSAHPFRPSTLPPPAHPTASMTCAYCGCSSASRKWSPAASTSSKLPFNVYTCGWPFFSFFFFQRGGWSKAEMKQELLIDGTLEKKEKKKGNSSCGSFSQVGTTIRSASPRRVSAVRPTGSNTQ